MALSSSEAQPGFSDSVWQLVDLPHDMHINAAPSRELCGTGCSGLSYLPRHSGWFRKRFRLPQEWERSSRLALVFEGVFRHSQIYLNGQLLAQHSCGYTSFEVELPAASLRFGDAAQENVVAVFVDATSGSGWWCE